MTSRTVLSLTQKFSHICNSVGRICGFKNRIREIEKPQMKMALSNITRQPADGAYQLVKNLLAKAHAAYDMTYRGYLANHLPHGLYTLCVLGASTSRLQQFHDMYVKRLEPIRESITIIDSSNWSENIGRKNLYSDYMRYFDDEVKSKGMQATFDLYFEKLMGESLGAALHPLINIGYAMEFSNPILLSEGLAYACIYPLKDTTKIVNDSDSNGASADTTIFHLIEELQTVEFSELYNEDWNFLKKMEFLLETHGTTFKDLIAKWDLTRADQLLAKLNELTEASILGVFGTYSKEIDFFLVHGLTGNHAVRIIFPYLPEQIQRQMLKVNLLGLLATYVLQQRPKIDVNFITGYKDTELEENMSWENILKRTISTDEEHVAKAVRTLIHYMETVPMAERSSLFTETFLKTCAFKFVDIVQEPEDYTF